MNAASGPDSGPSVSDSAIAASTKAVRIVISGQSPAVRAGLRAMLEGEQGLIVVGELTPGRPDQSHLPAADVFVVQLAAGGTAARVRDSLPDGAAILFVGAAPGAGGEAPGAGGPTGFVGTDVEAETLAAAVQALAAGLSVFDVSASAILRFAPGSGGGDQSDVSLTPRELEVLEAIALGLPNKGIALRLGISEHTAKFHVGSILAELGAASRTEAVMIATRKGLLAL